MLALGEAGERARRGALFPVLAGAGVEATFESGGLIGGAELDRCRGDVDRALGTLLDRRFRRDGVDREGRNRRRLVNIADRIDRADLEAVLALGESGERTRRDAERPVRIRYRVEATFEGPLLLGAEGELGFGHVDGARGARVDGRLRRHRIDREGGRRGRDVDVADGVDGSNLEGVGALRETAE